ncbi:hypothetical protein J0895_11590, partial [Phormidium pseudopriestleyi FRX01]
MFVSFYGHSFLFTRIRQQHKVVRRDRLLVPYYLEPRMLQLLPESSADIQERLLTLPMSKDTGI